MKRRISVEQLQELSEEQNEILREWWKPEIGDMVYTAGNWRIGVITEMVGTTLYVATSGPGGRVSPCIKEIIIPLLSIGQCLEFVNENGGVLFYAEPVCACPKPGESDIWGWSAACLSVPPRKYIEKELIDALWSAVKSVL